MLAGDEAGNEMFFKKEYDKGIKQYVWMPMPGFAMSGTYQYGSDKPISPTLYKEDIPRGFYSHVEHKIRKYYFEQDSKFYKENEDLYENDRKLYKELKEKNTEKIFHELVKMANDLRDEKGNVIAKRFRVKIIQMIRNHIYVQNEFHPENIPWLFNIDIDALATIPDEHVPSSHMTDDMIMETDDYSRFDTNALLEYNTPYDEPENDTAEIERIIDGRLNGALSEKGDNLMDLPKRDTDLAGNEYCR